MTSRLLAPLSLALCTVLALLTSGCAARPEAADLVLRGGTVITLDPERPRAEALAAREGVVVFVGSDENVQDWIGPGTRIVELRGRTAIPGFIEGHGHFLGIGNARIQLDLRGAESWPEIVDRVAAAARAAGPGVWVRGRGWHQEKWTSPPRPAVEGFPVHARLSALTPDNPVLLTHASGHAVFVNARALELAGIGADTPDPPGGQILRDAAGAPTGLLRESAQNLVRVLLDLSGATGHDAAAEAARREIDRMLELADEEVLAKGITTFTDAGSSFVVIDRMRSAAAQGRLGTRLWVMVREPNAVLAARLEDYLQPTSGDDHLTVGGIKLTLDGALGTRGAWLLEPYSDEPGSTGFNLVPLEEVRRTAEIALEHGVQLCIHAIGDRANREVLDLYEEAFAAHPGSDRRWRIEHAQHLDPDDIPRFARLGVIAAMQGIHCTSDGPWVAARLGEKRTREGAYVWRKLLDSGAVLVNGTDAPVEDVDPIASFYASVSRRLADGRRFYPEQRMTREEALISYTRDAAYGIRQEGIKGTLAPGKLADVTVLSDNPLAVDEDRIPEIRVEATIVGGVVRFSRD